MHSYACQLTTCAEDLLTTSHLNFYYVDFSVISENVNYFILVLHINRSLCVSMIIAIKKINRDQKFNRITKSYPTLAARARSILLRLPQLCHVPFQCQHRQQETVLLSLKNVNKFMCLNNWLTNI